MPPILVAHNRVTVDDDPSTRDVLAQVGFVTSALEQLAVEYRIVAVDPDSEPKADPGAHTVFNLVESPPGRPTFQVDVAAAFERQGLRLTGSSAETIRLTTHKIMTRARLERIGVAVAAGGELDIGIPTILDRIPPPWILKPALEDASLGLDDGAVTSDRAEAIRRGEILRREYAGQPVLVEHLLPGREFNLSVLAGDEGPEVLPAAELVFVDFPSDRPRIVGWAAKWDEGSFAYRHTVRRFLGPEEAVLARRLERIALAAWWECGLAGYGRVDVRLDEYGTPCVLEVNANPCISPDAGFAAAAIEAGLSPADVVGRILTASWKAA